MGSSQSSSRKITIPNEENANVMKVSDSVVQRLKGNEEKEVPRVRDEVRPPPTSSSQSGASGVPSSNQHYYEPSQTSLQILQEKEAELRKNDQYWEQRLMKLQDNHRNVSKVLEEEYDRAVDEVAQRFKNSPNKNSEPPCKEKRALVMECYKKHPNNSLACSPAVRAFTDCVDASRIKIVKG